MGENGLKNGEGLPIGGPFTVTKLLPNKMLKMPKNAKKCALLIYRQNA